MVATIIAKVRRIPRTMMARLLNAQPEHLETMSRQELAEHLGPTLATAAFNLHVLDELAAWNLGYKEWVTQHDTKVRTAHRLVDGRSVPLSAPFIVGGYPLQYPGDSRTAPIELWINCVVGSTQVTWPGQVVHAATASTHHGDLYEIVTAVGHRLTVTPNHPVLTPAGYQPAQALREGDRVLATREPVTPDVDHAPPSIEQVHGAIRQVGTASRVGPLHVNFHGDRPDAEVEVVRPDRELSLVWATDSLQHFRQLALTNSDGALSTGQHLGRLRAALDLGRVYAGGWLLTPTGSSSLVGSSGQSTPIGRGESGHPEEVRFAPAPARQTEFVQPPVDQPPGDAETAAHLQHAHTLGMEPTEIVEIHVLAGSHQVYNLSTSDEWYIGNGIAQHNCRCVLIGQKEPGLVQNKRALERQVAEEAEAPPPELAGGPEPPREAAKDANPHFADYPLARVNCPKACGAWEARRRGLDVEAGIGSPHTGHTYDSWFTPDPYEDHSLQWPVEVNRALAGHPVDRSTLWQSIGEQIRSDWPIGARGKISCMWLDPDTGRMSANGHVWVWEITAEHHTEFYDPQTGEVVGPDAMHWKRCDISTLSFWRWDHRQFTPQALDEIREDTNS